LFDISGITFGNVYLNFGTDATAKNCREHICSEILPNMLINSMDSGCIGGDFNCIIDKRDATSNPESKISKGLTRLVKLKNWYDSFRSIHSTAKDFSRYYENSRTDGASRIDRCYHFGNLEVKRAFYVPVAFSDHFCHVVEFRLPSPFKHIISPRSRPIFKIKPEVIKDDIFKEQLSSAVEQ